MKSTGIVRRLDDLNRKKYNPACIFCGEAADIRHFKGKNVCRECVGLMGQIALNKEVV